MSGINAILRAIVVKHTKVGGYPDTMAIARDAYNVARAPHPAHHCGSPMSPTNTRGE